MQGVSQRFLHFIKRYLPNFETVTRDVSPAATHYFHGLFQSDKCNMERMEEAVPDADEQQLQHFLSVSPWEADAVCAQVTREANITLGGHPDSSLIIDESAITKKGTHSAGVARQYNGRLGKIDNCQVGVFLAYCAPGGARALIDRELYVPGKWAQDRDRCAAAGIGGDVAFATKPKLAEAMIGRAVQAGVPFKWVAGDEAYGGNPGLREWLEAGEIPYVLAVACNAMIETKAGAKRADGLAGLVPAGAWQRLSCADGSKGPRLYDWALIATGSDRHWLLARRSLQPGEKGDLELAFYRCYSPRPATLAELAAVAGARWGVEDCFAEAKGEAGLDHYQVRRYRAWYRHVTLSMLAHAFLAAAAHAARPAPPPPEPVPASGNPEKGTAKRGT